MISDGCAERIEYTTPTAITVCERQLAAVLMREFARSDCQCPVFLPLSVLSFLVTVYFHTLTNFCPICLIYMIHFCEVFSL